MFGYSYITQIFIVALKSKKLKETHCSFFQFFPAFNSATSWHYANDITLILFPWVHSTIGQRHYVFLILGWTLQPWHSIHDQIHESGHFLDSELIQKPNASCLVSSGLICIFPHWHCCFVFQHLQLDGHSETTRKPLKTCNFSKPYGLVSHVLGSRFFKK